ncbi:hypothetical protein HNP38_002751 [Chryseobacterium defluvii]|uniref:Uncharacterized protein n=1 Tax=Chryseobacterium defluvii TaxID=160396 RepID=A0A840KFP9_9FLAO|nr:hypothetical protein [Chryseobacterium defluvii]
MSDKIRQVVNAKGAELKPIRQGGTAKNLTPRKT